MLQDDTNVGSCVSLCACVYRCRNVSSALTEINKQILMVFVDLGFSNELIQPKEWCKKSLSTAACFTLEESWKECRTKAKSLLLLENCK